MHTADVKEDRALHFLETFLFSGISALLVSVPRFHPDYAFVSLFALVPLLWRAIRVGLAESFLLGALFGALFYFVTAQVALSESPNIIISYLPPVVILLAFYCAAVNRIAKLIGFNAIFLAILWLPVEYALGYCSHLSGIFVFTDLDSSIVVRISSLFGVLMVSFLVALINSLMLIASEYLARALHSKNNRSAAADEEIQYVDWEASPKRHYYSTTNPRAPPMIPCLQ